MYTDVEITITFNPNSFANFRSCSSFMFSRACRNFAIVMENRSWDVSGIVNTKILNIQRKYTLELKPAEGNDVISR